MKTRTQSNTENNTNSIYLEAETPEENMTLLAIAKRTKKPNRAFGHYRDNGLLWIWVEMPARKLDNYDITKVNSGD